MAVLLSHEELIKLMANTGKKPVKMFGGGVLGDMGEDLSNISKDAQSGGLESLGNMPKATGEAESGMISDPNFDTKTMDWLAKVDPGKAIGNAFKGATGSNGVTPIDPSQAYDMSKNATVTPGQITAPTQGPAPVTIGAYNPATAATINTTSLADPALTANLAQLQQMASGKGPSVSGTQLEQGRQANIAAIMAQANSSRGGYNPMQARQAMQAGASLNAKANQEAALQRLQEQQAAMGLISSQGTAMRGQDIGAATTQAQMQTQVSLQNAAQDLNQKVAQGQITAAQAQQLFAAQQQAAQQNAQMQTTAAVDQASLRQKYLQMGYSADQANNQAQVDLQKIAAQKQAGILGAAGTFGSGLMQSGALSGLFGGSEAAGGLLGGEGALIGTGGVGSGVGLGGAGEAVGGVAEIGGMVAAKGGVVPGKAPKPGDHPENDIIPARLSPGEFVIPRSLTSDKELMSLVHKKMAEHEAAKQNTTKAAASFADVIKAHQDLTKKVEDLKKMFAGGAVPSSRQVDNIWIGNPDKDGDDKK